MKRIEPECFVGIYKHHYVLQEPPIYTATHCINIEELDNILEVIDSEINTTIALCKIQPQTTSLAERMERRRKNNMPNYNLLTP